LLYVKKKIVITFFFCLILFNIKEERNINYINGNICFLVCCAQEKCLFIYIFLSRWTIRRESSSPTNTTKKIFTNVFSPRSNLVIDLFNFWHLVCDLMTYSMAKNGSWLHFLVSLIKLNDWMKFSQKKNNLIFLISNIFDIVSREMWLWRYE